VTNENPEAIIAAIPDDAPADDGEVLLEKLNHQIVKVNPDGSEKIESAEKSTNPADDAPA
jgi:hypothetical protein